MSDKDLLIESAYQIEQVIRCSCRSYRRRILGSECHRAACWRCRWLANYKALMEKTHDGPRPPA